MQAAPSGPGSLSGHWPEYSPQKNTIAPLSSSPAFCTWIRVSQPSSLSIAGNWTRAPIWVGMKVSWTLTWLEALRDLAVTLAFPGTVPELRVTVATPATVSAVVELRVPRSVAKTTGVPSATGLSLMSLTSALMVEPEVPSAGMLARSAVTVTEWGQPGLIWPLVESARYQSFLPPISLELASLPKDLPLAPPLQSAHSGSFAAAPPSTVPSQWPASTMLLKAVCWASAHDPSLLAKARASIMVLAPSSRTITLSVPVRPLSAA